MKTTRSFDFLLDRPIGEPLLAKITGNEVMILRTWARRNGVKITIRKVHRNDHNCTERWLTVHGRTGIPDGICTRMASVPVGQSAVLTYHGEFAYVRQCGRDLATCSPVIVRLTRPYGASSPIVNRYSSLVPPQVVARVYRNITRHPLMNSSPGDLIEIGEECIREHCDVDFMAGDLVWRHDDSVRFTQEDEKYLRRVS